jgi:hypothetical protein
LRGAVARVGQTAAGNLQECAKENSFGLGRCIELPANGERRERGPGNQGWGLGNFSLPRLPTN